MLRLATIFVISGVLIAACIAQFMFGVALAQLLNRPDHTPEQAPIQSDPVILGPLEPVPMPVYPAPRWLFPGEPPVDSVPAQPRPIVGQNKIA